MPATAHDQIQGLGNCGLISSSGNTCRMMRTIRSKKLAGESSRRGAAEAGPTIDKIKIRTARRRTNERRIHPPSSSSAQRSEEHTSELQSQSNLVCRLLLEKKKTKTVSES